LKLVFVDPITHEHVVRETNILTGISCVLAANALHIDSIWYLYFFTGLQFRFTEYQNKSRTFCRRFTVSSKYSIPELLYDCRWTNAQDHYKTFIFDYEAQRESHRESGKYWFKLPAYGELGKKIICACIKYASVSLLLFSSTSRSISKPSLSFHVQLSFYQSIHLHVIESKLLN
jgi:hypothetical protein